MAYVNSESTINEKSPFRRLFNRFKNVECEALNNLPEEIIDSNNITDDRLRIVDWTFDSRAVQCSDLIDPATWKVVSLHSLGDDLLIFKNILASEASTKWFNRLYHEWPIHEASVLKSHVSLPINESDKKKLRWLTFGVHHNWDTKVYDEKKVDPVPSELKQLFESISQITRLNVRPEGGIINFYSCRNRLSPHRDVSEINLTVPLLSLSLGTPAIFMIGGDDESIEPIESIVLYEGDLIVMRGRTRTSYHAVPKIFCLNNDSVPRRHKQMSRININVRQVW